MGSGGKGGSQQQTSVVELPPEIKEIALQNLGIADEVASMGYVPYQGATQAALTPMQKSAMDSRMQARAGMNMSMPEGWNRKGKAKKPRRNGGIDPYTGMAMQAEESGGVFGYSPMGIYEAAQSQIAPAQRAFIDSFFIDPQTGASPVNPVVPSAQYDPFGVNPTPEPEPEPEPAPTPGANPHMPGTTEYEQWEHQQLVARHGHGYDR